MEGARREKTNLEEGAVDNDGSRAGDAGEDLLEDGERLVFACDDDAGDSREVSEPRETAKAKRTYPSKPPAKYSSFVCCVLSKTAFRRLILICSLAFLFFGVSSGTSIGRAGAT